jgi:2-polyprenyl-3-methyl-5-hydroxy-6-metoxy-1,4-benzoquinol methylase
MPENKTQNHNTYLPGYTTVAHHEWRTVENSAAYLLPRLQHLASQNPNLQILDVGCGSGTITASLVPYLPSNGHITAIDLSPEIVSRASAHAQKLGSAVSDKITFTPASVYILSQTLPKGTFDIVHTSQMLVHLDSPVAALKEMWSCYPDTETMRAWHRVQLATHEASGGSNAAGPSLVAWAMKAGAKRGDIDASMGAWMYSTEEERRVWGE